MYEVVWPGTRKSVKRERFAKRINNLEGKTICELWDWIFRGDESFPVIEKELKKRYPGANFVSYKEFGSIHQGDEAAMLASLGDKLKQHNCDAVITGWGC